MLGCPLARAFADKGYRVLGFDTDPAKVEKLGTGRELHRPHLATQSVAAMVGGWLRGDRPISSGSPSPTPSSSACRPR